MGKLITIQKITRRKLFKLDLHITFLYQNKTSITNQNSYITLFSIPKGVKLLLESFFFLVEYLKKINSAYTKVYYITIFNQKKHEELLYIVCLYTKNNL